MSESVRYTVTLLGWRDWRAFPRYVARHRDEPLNLKTREHSFTVSGRLLGYKRRWGRTIIDMVIDQSTADQIAGARPGVVQDRRSKPSTFD